MIKRYFLHLCILLILSLLNLKSEGQDLHFEKGESNSPLVSLETYYNKTKPFSIQFILSNPTIFKPHNSRGFNLKLNSKNNWIKIVLANKDTTVRDVIIEFTNPFLDKVHFYTVDSLKIVDSLVSEAGSSFKQGGRQHPNFQYLVRIPAKNSLTCFSKINVGTLSGDFILLLWDKEKRREYQLQETKYLSYFFIINITFLLLIVLAIMQTRLRYHWYYFFYAFFGFLFIYADVGLGYKNVWSDFPRFQNAASFIIANIYQVFGLSFVRKYFNLKATSAFADKAFQILIYSGLLFLILSSVNILLSPHLSTPLVIVNTFIFLLSGLSVFVVALNSLQFKSLRNDAIWFVIGFAPHACSILALCLRPFGMFNNTIEWWFQSITPVYIETTHTPNFLFWAVVWEVIIVFALIIKRLKNIYEERNTMMQQLALQKERNMSTLLSSIEKERQRIAQELHDSSGVGLSTLKMKLNILKETTAYPMPAKATITELMRDVDKLYEDIRNISHNLMPKTLSKLGLLPAINELVNQFRIAAPNLNLNYYSKVLSHNFSETAKINIYRIIQELLTNMVKHSGAKEVSLQLIQHKDGLMISIEDDGVGFNTRETKNGIGLAGIASRVQMLNGNLSIDASPQNGTFVSVFLPVIHLY